MRNILFFIMFNFFLATQTLAENQPVMSFPMLGVVAGTYLHVPVYRKNHGKMPERLFAYGGGKEFIAKLRIKTPYTPTIKYKGHSCDDGEIGSYTYETQLSSDQAKVVVFDKKKEIKFDNGKIIEPASHTQWEIFFLTSNEGVHDILRAKQNGVCIYHIYYYTHCDYDTEADSAQAFIATMCGKKINGQ